MTIYRPYNYSYATYFTNKKHRQRECVLVLDPDAEFLLSDVHTSVAKIELKGLTFTPPKRYPASATISFSARLKEEVQIGRGRLWFYVWFTGLKLYKTAPGRALPKTAKSRKPTEAKTR